MGKKKKERLNDKLLLKVVSKLFTLSRKGRGFVVLSRFTVPII